MKILPRQATHRYRDPLEIVWSTCAERIGFGIVRSGGVYASFDGKGNIVIGDESTLDPDDCLAQMILHELCHALIEGEEGETRVDWGLDNTSSRDLVREQACLRLQAFLADSVGLREFLAPTTQFRVSLWSRLGEDPFSAAPEQGGRREPSCVAGRIGAWRASRPRWAPHLKAALASSAAIAAVVPNARYGREPPEEMPLLWEMKGAPPLYHPTGHAPQARYYSDHGCRDCAWAYGERGGHRCHHAPLIRIGDYAPACVRWEPASELDCLTCGACCREAYHAIEVGSKERRIVKSLAELVERIDGHHRLKRDGNRCVALMGGRVPDESFTCSIYEARPKTCRDFQKGSENCLDARRRVGLSL